MQSNKSLTRDSDANLVTWVKHFVNLIPPHMHASLEQFTVNKVPRAWIKAVLLTTHLKIEDDRFSFKDSLCHCSLQSDMVIDSHLTEKYQ